MPTATNERLIASKGAHDTIVLSSRSCTRCSRNDHFWIQRRTLDDAHAPRTPVVTLALPLPSNTTSPAATIAIGIPGVPSSGAVAHRQLALLPVSFKPPVTRRTLAFR
jgi:hypothetical protein